MVNTMARRTDGGVRFRPVGSQRSRTAPVYSPRGTGCPAIEQAVQGLYKGQNEESFWSLMSALNYALELETHVLVPLQTALSAQGAPAPWMEHPIPAEKADGLALWTLRNDKGRCWLPLFTSVAAAGADRSTASRPMADRTLEQAMQLALDTPGIDGVVLTKLDGDARGGAALSIRASTGKPIKFVGTGEKLDMIEPFHPDRMASRILGMGDMLSFIEKAQQTYDENQAAKLEEKLRKNRLTLQDYYEQLQQLRNMGDLSQIASMMPGALGRQMAGATIDDKALAHTEAIILSMTPLERENPQILNASRKKRIAAGCGLEVVDVNRLLKQFDMMQQLTKQMTRGRLSKMGGGGLGSRMHGFGRKKRLK